MVVRFDEAAGYDLTCKPGVMLVQAYILGRWGPVAINSGCVTTKKLPSGGWSRHNEGRAGDTGVRPIGHPLGEEIRQWLYDNRYGLGCQQIIYNHKVYSASSGNDNWRPYDIDPHADHIHWELNWDGATRKTSWFAQPQEEEVTPADIDAVAAAVNAQVGNRIIGTLQTNMKQEWIPAIVQGVLESVGSSADADAIVDKIVERLSN